MKAAHFDRRLPSEPFRGAYDALRLPVCCTDIERIQIANSFQVQPIVDIHIVLGIIGQHEEGVGIEPLDQHPTLVVLRGVIGTSKQTPSARRDNLLGCVKKLRRNIDIVDEVEKPEKPGQVPMKLVVSFVYDSCYPTNRLPIAKSKKGKHGAVIVERVRLLSKSRNAPRKRR